MNAANAQALRLHLGCGERYFSGYLNIDFPSAQHTVQKRSVADLHADLLRLRYALESVDEIRLHHVFEHFPRDVACGLLAAWQSWLKLHGVLHIEVPDLVRTGLAAINPFASRRRRGVAQRHLFGSHEAPWASHKEGYSSAALRNLLRLFGFNVSEIRRNSWQGTYNFEIIALKQTALGRSECDAAARAYLRLHLLDDSETEQRLLEMWMKHYASQADACWAPDT